MGKTYILNSAILTSPGLYSYRPVGLEEAKALLAEGFTSAIGHPATAQFMSSVLGVQIPQNRIAVEMKEGDRALVFRVLTRLPEGRVLGEEELKATPYELGVLAHLGTPICPHCGEPLVGR
jgi:hypothetical protein